MGRDEGEDEWIVLDARLQGHLIWRWGCKGRLWGRDRAWGRGRGKGRGRCRGRGRRGARGRGVRVGIRSG